jgi:FkbM family methyltransferase
MVDSIMIRQTKENIWIIDGDKWVSAWVEESGELAHDKYIIPQLIRHIPVNGVAIDCGCYIGDHTIAYADAVGSGGRVIAIDPNQEAIQCLVKNLDKYKDNVIAFNRYVGNKHNDSAFFSRNNENVGASKMLIDGMDINDNLGDIIQSMTLDSLIGIIDKCDFLKLDVEGNEVFALEGAANLIMKFRPTMFIEVNRGALQEHGFDHETIRAALDMYGYHGVNIPDCADTEPQYDILAIPNERK